MSGRTWLRGTWPWCRCASRVGSRTRSWKRWPWGCPSSHCRGLPRASRRASAPSGSWKTARKLSPRASSTCSRRRPSGCGSAARRGRSSRSSTRGARSCPASKPWSPRRPASSTSITPWPLTAQSKPTGTEPGLQGCTMRDLLLVSVFFPMLPFAFIYPWMGILLWSWVSYMSPHRLTFGFAYDMPFGMIAALTTLAGILFSREKKRLPRAPEVIFLLALWAWVTITSFFAIHSDLAWDKWQQVSKILLMTLATMMICRDAGRLRPARRLRPHRPRHSHDVFTRRLHRPVRRLDLHVHQVAHEGALVRPPAAGRRPRGLRRSRHIREPHRDDRVLRPGSERPGPPEGLVAGHAGRARFTDLRRRVPHLRAGRVGAVLPGHRAGHRRPQHLLPDARGARLRRRRDLRRAADRHVPGAAARA